jgi:hypothetical protein
MELLIWTAVCALIGLGCLGGAVWAVIGGEDVGVERIFMVLVWLLFAAIFLGMSGWIARMGPLRELGKKAPAKQEEEKEVTTERAAS